MKNKFNLLLKLIISTIIIFIVYNGLLYFFDPRPQIYRDHNLIMLRQPIDAKNFQVISIDGKAESIDFTKNQANLLIMWATWCKYCTKEIPLADKILQNNASKSINFIAMLEPNGKIDAAKKFFKQKEITNINVKLDYSAEYFSALKIGGIPSYYLADKNGLIFAKLNPDWDNNNFIELLIEATKFR